MLPSDWLGGVTGDYSMKNYRKNW